MRILIIGHGRMGRLVEQLASQHGCEVVDIVTRSHALANVAAPFDVAIDFSVAAAVVDNVTALVGRRASVVIGSTGWQSQAANVREVAEAGGIGVLASANFSLGLNAFVLVVEEAARRFGPYADYGAWIHETHHAMKRDAPSGTALMLENGMRSAGYRRGIDVSSTRAGSVPGTHTVGFDGPADTVTLTHTVRDRAVFAHGALEAAKWLHGRQGWFEMRDMLGDVR